VLATEAVWRRREFALLPSFHHLLDARIEVVPDLNHLTAVEFLGVPLVALGAVATDAYATDPHAVREHDGGGNLRLRPVPDKLAGLPVGDEDYAVGAAVRVVEYCP